MNGIKNLWKIFIVIILFPSAWGEVPSVVHITPEFGEARVGGLGKLVTDLAEGQVVAGGNRVRVILPFYEEATGKGAFPSLFDVNSEIMNFKTNLSGAPVDLRVKVYKKIINGVEVYSVQPLDGANKNIFKIDNKNPYNLGDSSGGKGGDASGGDGSQVSAKIAQGGDASGGGGGGENENTIKKWNIFENLAASLIAHWQKNPKEKIDIAHFHHWGTGAKILREKLSAATTKMPGVIKTFHSLEEDLGNLDDQLEKRFGGKTATAVAVKESTLVATVSEGSYKELVKSKKDDMSEIAQVVKEKEDKGRIFFVNNSIKAEDFSFSGVEKLLQQPAEKAIFAQHDISGKKRTSAEMLKKLLDEKKLQGQAALGDFSPERPSAIYVGRLSPEKGYERLKTLAVTAKDNNTNLIVMGIPQSHDAKVFMESFKNEHPQVVILDTFELQMEMGLLARASSDVHVLLSNREAAGLVLMEGQALGAKVLAPDLEGIENSLGKDDLGRTHPDSASLFNLSRGSDGAVDETKTLTDLNAKFVEVINEFSQASAEEKNKKYEGIMKRAEKFDLQDPKQGMVKHWNYVYEEAQRLEKENNPTFRLIGKNIAAKATASEDGQGKEVKSVGKEEVGKILPVNLSQKNLEKIVYEVDLALKGIGAVGEPIPPFLCTDERGVLSDYERIDKSFRKSLLILRKEIIPSLDINLDRDLNDKRNFFKSLCYQRKLRSQLSLPVTSDLLARIEEGQEELQVNCPRGTGLEIDRKDQNDVYLEKDWKDLSDKLNSYKNLPHPKDQWDNIGDMARDYTAMERKWMENGKVLRYKEKQKIVGQYFNIPESDLQDNEKLNSYLKKMEVEVNDLRDDLSDKDKLARMNAALILQSSNQGLKDRALARRERIKTMEEGLKEIQGKLPEEERVKFETEVQGIIEDLKAERSEHSLKVKEGLQRDEQNRKNYQFEFKKHEYKKKDL